jgi:RNA polymerase sigma-70 factor (ECF subfamily)
VISDSENPAELLRRSSRDPEAFAAFYSRYFETVLAYLARRTFDAEVALDLTAEAFAQAYVARDRFRGKEKAQAEAWIYKIAKRQLARYLRKGKLERRAINQLGIQVPVVDAARRARIDELADLEWTREVLDASLARLSQEQSDALRLRVVNELPYSEVAERLKITEQAARLRVSRALKVLNESLDANPTLRGFRA